ncbi:MAG: hypothetical protein K6A65_09220 [Succinivibrionaceae bacterium]|nr:hypothetical protein [Succinivibrionaceae bacterium]
MKNRTAVYNDVVQLYKSKVISWLREYISSQGSKINGFPCAVNLNAPSERIANSNRDTFLAFCRSWQGTDLPSGHVEFQSRTVPDVGEVKVPVQVIFGDACEVASWAGHLVEFQTSLARLTAIRDRLPALVESAISCIDYLTAFEEEDFSKFLDVCDWLCQNPHSGCLIRQIPVRGVDSAWFESHRSLLLSFLGQGLGLDRNRRDLLQLGLVPPPALVKVVLLDPELRALVGGMRYFSVTIEDLARMQIAPEQVIFTESLETALSIPERNGTMLLVTPPQLISEIAELESVTNARCFYLGSISSRSFAVLNNLRVHLPRTISLLLKEEIFVQNRDLWTYDDRLLGEVELLLTPSENSLFLGMQRGAYGRSHPRIPLERIPLDLIFSALGIKEPPRQAPRPQPQVAQGVPEAPQVPSAPDPLAVAAPSMDSAPEPEIPREPDLSSLFRAPEPRHEDPLAEPDLGPAHDGGDEQKGGDAEPEPKEEEAAEERKDDGPMPEIKVRSVLDDDEDSSFISSNKQE